MHGKLKKTVSKSASDRFCGKQGTALTVTGQAWIIRIRHAGFNFWD